MKTNSVSGAGARSRLNPNIPVSSARSRWVAEYRRARASYRFAVQFQSLTGNYLYSVLCEGIPRTFDFCRFHGDHLQTYGGHHGMVTHRARMNYLRDRVRLPA